MKTIGKNSDWFSSSHGGDSRENAKMPTFLEGSEFMNYSS
jgi:hypothetical protein